MRKVIIALLAVLAFAACGNEGAPSQIQASGSTTTTQITTTVPQQRCSRDFKPQDRILLPDGQEAVVGAEAAPLMNLFDNAGGELWVLRSDLDVIADIQDGRFVGFQLVSPEQYLPTCGLRSGITTAKAQEMIPGLVRGTFGDPNRDNALYLRSDPSLYLIEVPDSDTCDFRGVVDVIILVDDSRSQFLEEQFDTSCDPGETRV